MKTVLKIVFWLLSFFFAYMIYNSINGPIKFEKVKKKRYADVIAKLKDIRNAEEAYLTVNGSYTGSFDKLIQFVDTAKFTITQQRDSSYMAYDETYRIDMLKEVVIIDTLGTKSVKDSLFKNSDRYKTLMNVPHAANNEKFDLKVDVLEQSGYQASVFEAKVAKSVVLHDQPKDLVTKESQVISVDDINGPEIIVGSLSEVSTSGNWPTIYDSKKDK
ncbi:hypothetical protein SAMN04487906_1774 [Zhouia amylolytica]|uniref:Uncharacterized protein n=2 Tax=Zhouia amylolytica TaxID=376730 RepID=W2UR40_9FLAO|nr:hypothetical protein [Zhouia amylolytica]ETN96409.1 hypothetical protein P278_06770 [Zhouia amylolytica AD3]MCQ0112658.1 hypothetical protein [Zhouia amylolytica]SFS82883.1 hypothetical protein SAMN04487906_1774 [Zhouia amylolytica]